MLAIRKEVENKKQGVYNLKQKNKLWELEKKGELNERKHLNNNINNQGGYKTDWVGVSTTDL